LSRGWASSVEPLDLIALAVASVRSDLDLAINNEPAKLAGVLDLK
jgi:hypothetical protein